MTFPDKIHALIQSYDSDACEVHRNVVLYGVNKTPPPIADHFIFTPMSESLIQELKESYEGEIPQTLIDIYRVMNGAQLFSTTRYSEAVKRYLPYFQLSIHGVQIRYPENMYVQYDISVEDSESPDGTPMSWLMFAGYYKPGDSHVMYDFFVDTNTGKVYSQVHHDLQCKTVESWDSIDECLCSIFDILSEKKPC